MDKHEFAEFVIDSRDKAELTLKEFAAELGVDWVTVWRWENKRSMPKPDAIEFWIEKILYVVD